MKFPRTIDEHLKEMADKNLVIDNTEDATLFLKNVNYYRFKWYLRPFKSDEDNKNYIKHSNFIKIRDIYCLDNDLRNLSLKALSIIEISLRAKIIDSLCLSHNDCYPQKKESYFYRNFESIKNRICKSIPPSCLKNRHENKDCRYCYHIKKYNINTLEDFVDKVPFWVLMESLSFGNVSYIYKNLCIKYKQKISSIFNVSEKILQNFLENLVDFRNLCAHHEKIFNVEMKRKIRTFDDKLRGKKIIMSEKNNNFKNIFFLIDFMIYRLDESNSWNKDVSLLFFNNDTKYRQKGRIVSSYYGFDEGYFKNKP